MGLLAGACFAAPEPSILPGPLDWTVDVTFEHPAQITLQPSNGGKPKRFWYTIITLTNKTGRDVDFYPQCDLMTDTFELIPAGRKTPTVVFGHIKKRHEQKYPFMEPLEKTGNKLLQGEDNTKDIAIIWPDFDLRAKGITIFIGGLSNETAVIEHPVAKDAAGKPMKVYLRKTLELNYGLSGDPALRSYAKPAYKGKRWIMR